MYTELHATIREIVICAEIILEFEVLDTPQYDATKAIHRWVSFLSSLCDKLMQMNADPVDLVPYYRTMNAPLRRVLEHTDGLLGEQSNTLTLNQHYSFARIRRLTMKTMRLAQDSINTLSHTKSDGVSTSS